MTDPNFRGALMQTRTFFRRFKTIYKPKNLAFQTLDENFGMKLTGEVAIGRE